jgi:general secretion pathway protein D
MKTIMTKPIIILAAATLGFGAFAQAQNERSGGNTARPQTPPAAAPAPQSSGSETNADDPQQMVSALIQAAMDAQQGVTDEQAADGGTNNLGDAQPPRSIRGQGTRGTTGSSSNAISLTALVAQQSTNHTAMAAKTFLLNFRNAPLSLVLDYLSDAAGFIISANSKVDLKGTVTVWSNQPVDRDEAVRILHKALSEHNYAATVEGNVLNIYVLDSSNAEIVAGVPNNDFTNVPPTKDLVTQIVYVRNVEAGQLITSLQPLMPNGTSMTANQGANAIIITDTKANIRRMVQLVKSLDTASVSASTVKVFPLTYADATALVPVVQQLFPGTGAGATQGGGQFPGFFGRFGPGGGRGQPDSSSSTQAGRVAAAKVVAAADDRSNSLIVSASEEQMALVDELVRQVDVNVDGVTELRVFRLLYADPQETADQLTSLFPDPTTQQNSNNRGGFRGFMFGGPPGANPASSTTGTSARKLQQTRVTAVPDPRTGSVIVSAARDLMEQIASIIQSLDSDPAKKKKVYVIKVENRDPQAVVEDLQSVIATDSSGNFSTTRSSSQQSGSQLNTRQQNNLRNTGNNNNTFGTGFGTSGSRTGR